jgi:hypothetical protein
MSKAQSVKSARRLFKLDADYSPPLLDGFSFDLSLAYRGRVAASVRAFAETGAHLFVPARTVLDLGACSRFLVVGRPMLIRVQLENLTDAGGWEPTGPGAFGSSNHAVCR